jgi:GntR family transcriptional regulator/MocR family aminotransferase
MLSFHIALESREGLARQIFHQLRTAIKTGRLKAGDRLPPSRSLAAQLDVSRRTVTEVYELLASEGFVEGRVGVGTIVLGGMSTPNLISQRPAAAIPLPRWQEITTPLLGRPERPAGLNCDFRCGVGDSRLFPHESWRTHLMRASREQAKGGRHFMDPNGLFGLRVLIGRQLALGRAIEAHADDILITHGAQQAIALLAHVLVAPGDCVAVEDPGYPPARTLFQSMGARVIGVPVDDEGLCVDALPADAKLVYVTPSHQFPLGMAMSLSRRIALLEWARRTGAVIVEDDYDSDFRYEGRSIEALRALDQHGLVAYIGTFSKAMFTDLRIGYLLSPPGIRTAVRQAKHLADWSNPSLEQLALQSFMQSGDYARHLRRCHRQYMARRQLILQALNGPLSRWLTPVRAVAGIHLAALLKAPHKAGPISGRARERGVGVDSISHHFYQQPVREGLMFGFGDLPTLAIEQGLAQLYGLLREG